MNSYKKTDSDSIDKVSDFSNEVINDAKAKGTNELYSI